MKVRREVSSLSEAGAGDGMHLTEHGCVSGKHVHGRAGGRAGRAIIMGAAAREAGIGDFISDGLSGGGRESLEGVVRLTEDELPMEPGATRAGRRRQASEPRAHRASQPSSRSCAR